jgi:hypothetical protein
VQHQLRTIPVLDIGRVDDHENQQADRVDEDVPLATIDLFARIVTVRPPFSVVFTDWLSMTAALGFRCVWLPRWFELERVSVREVFALVN